ALRRADDGPREEGSGRVAVPDVVAGVDRARRRLGQEHASREGVVAALEGKDAGLSPVPLAQRPDPAAERRLVVGAHPGMIRVGRPGPWYIPAIPSYGGES